MTEHHKYKYSITLYSEDLAVVNCLRALSQYSQRTGNNRIPWGGTTDKNWKKNKHQVTFRFNSPEYRNGFKSEIERLLPNNLWNIVLENDNDPAIPPKK